MECRNCLKYNGKACEFGLTWPCGVYVPHIINPSDKQGDLISRSALLGAFREYMIERFDRERCSSEESCKVCDRPCLWIRKVGEAPAVDAVEVVRCKDCKKYQPETKDWIAHCTFTGIQTNTDDFCSYGERKDNVDM